MVDTIKLINKQLIDKLEEIQLPKIKKFLMNLGTIENDNDFKCSFCNSWSGKNKASLAAHIRNCKFNPKNKEIEISNVDFSEPNTDTNLNNLNLVLTIDTNTTTTETSVKKKNRTTKK
jgi:hypothetical protein